jgi:hypothetical protein
MWTMLAVLASARAGGTVHPLRDINELEDITSTELKFGGLKFLDAAHIKDMLALLRFVENPRPRQDWDLATVHVPHISAAASEHAR